MAPVLSNSGKETGDNNIDSLISENRWKFNPWMPSIFGPRYVSYSFTNSFSDYASGYPDASVHARSFQAFSSTQRTAFYAWERQFESVSGIRLGELTGTSDANAVIKVAMSDDPIAAYAYGPQTHTAGGDMWFNRTKFNAPTLGSYAFRAIGHELGHALGLEHGHEKNGIRNVAMNSDRDSMEFSIMTYRSYVGKSLGSGYSNETFGHAQSLMMYDIAAMQQMYGANFSTNNEYTYYTFDPKTGQMFVNGVGQGTPGDNRIFRTIWDGGGSDTYDFTNYTTNLSVDLRPGFWTDLDVGGNSQRANLGDGRFARGHIFNALQYNGSTSSLIEDAWGGSGNDKLVGNEANNQLVGMGGSDKLYGGKGDDKLYGATGIDYLYGEDGNDTLDGGFGADVMKGGLGNDRYYVDSVKDQVVELAGQGVDTVYASFSYTLSDQVEQLVLESSNCIGAGNSANNNIWGFDGAGTDTLKGKKGNDRIYGRGGDDILKGARGNDHLDGGSGKDSIFGGHDNDVIEGGTGNDKIYGQGGNDILCGATLDHDTYGEGEFDKLWSGSTDDRDTFVLGYDDEVLYYGGKSLDFALIKDFDKENRRSGIGDRIQLTGNRSDYSLSDVKFKRMVAAGIHYKGDLIGLVKGYNSNQLNLASTSQFTWG